MFHLNTPQSYKVKVLWDHNVISNIKWLATKSSRLLFQDKDDFDYLEHDTGDENDITDDEDDVVDENDIVDAYWQT